MNAPPPPSFSSPLARRGWLKLCAMAAAFSAGATAWWAWRAGQRSPDLADVEAAMLERVVDILVPKDDTPGAVELGVHHTVQHLIQASTPLALACSQLYQTLDRAASVGHRQAFLNLKAPEQDALLQAVAQEGRTNPGWPGLMQLREHTLQQYFALPQAQPLVSLPGAPQPVGFMDYTEAPRPRA